MSAHVLLEIDPEFVHINHILLFHDTQLWSLTVFVVREKKDLWGKEYCTSGGSDFLQDDSTPIHKTLRLTEWSTKSFFLWMLQSLHLNPTEYLWEILEGRFRQRSLPTSQTKWLA